MPPAKRRDAAQVLFIFLKAQAELLEALLLQGSLSRDAARPLVQYIELAATIWRADFEEGEAFMSGPLLRLHELLGSPSR